MPRTANCGRLQRLTRRSGSSKSSTTIRRFTSREARAFWRATPHQEDSSHLRYGFECDAGWAALIREISDVAVSLVRVLRAFGFQDDARITPCVVKEKLGGLRWQFAHNLLPPFAELFRAYASWVEQKSNHVCERSGKFGQLRQISGRLVTLSDEEYEKELRRKTSPKA